MKTSSHSQRTLTDLDILHVCRLLHHNSLLQMKLVTHLGVPQEEIDRSLDCMLDMTSALYDMLQYWKISIADKEEAWNTLLAAFVETGSESVAHWLLNKRGQKGKKASISISLFCTDR